MFFLVIFKLVSCLLALTPFGNVNTVTMLLLVLVRIQQFALVQRPQRVTLSLVYRLFFFFFPHTFWHLCHIFHQTTEPDITNARAHA